MWSLGGLDPSTNHFLGLLGYFGLLGVLWWYFFHGQSSRGTPATRPDIGDSKGFAEGDEEFKAMEEFYVAWTSGHIPMIPVEQLRKGRGRKRRVHRLLPSRCSYSYGHPRLSSVDYEADDLFDCSSSSMKQFIDTYFTPPLADNGKTEILIAFVFVLVLLLVATAHECFHFSASDPFGFQPSSDVFYLLMAVVAFFIPTFGKT
jgi:hypothetical protein